MVKELKGKAAEKAGVKKSYSKDKVCYRCELCGLIYQDANDAEKCETFCKNTHSCSMKLMKKAINIKK